MSSLAYITEQLLKPIGPEQNMVIATMGFNLKSGPLQDPDALWEILAGVLPSP